MQEYAIHWFRRDLRIHGNPGLSQSYKDFKGRVLGFFCFDPIFLSREDFSHNRFQFFLERIKCLKDELKLCGGDLIVVDKGPDSAFESLFEFIKQKGLKLPTRISLCKDYEPFAIARDQRIEKLVKKNGIDFNSYRDHLLIEPNEVYKDSPDSGYQVYTPFSRKWLQVFETDIVQSRVLLQKKPLEFLKDLSKGKGTKIFEMQWNELGLNIEDKLENYINFNKKKVTVQIPSATASATVDALKEFEKKINDYSEARDIPSLQGTSLFSLFLKNGSLNIAQLIAYYELTPYKKSESSRDKFFSELIWREFYYHILFRHPRVEHESFNLKYKDIKWENNPKYFEAWINGRTGFPIVDAGMRQLKTTGWMHNRVRMIVASFLTKDLLIDWRWGEKYFMQQLLDGDLAPNNGGWQWAASTGCDPQPYFRIFNPWSQSEKFDPEGIYIKHFVPELTNIPSHELHSPIMDSNYIKPIVDHSTQREKALSLYKHI